MKTIIDYLERQQEQGNQWAVFEGDTLPDSTLNFNCFASSLEAESYCSCCQWYPDREEGSYKEINDRYHAIPSLLEEYRALTIVPEFRYISPVQVSGMLQAQGFELEPGKGLELASIQLGYGRIIAAVRRHDVIPEEIIDGYHIVEHHHQYAGGLVYELGHSATIRLSFDSRIEAEVAFRQLAHTIPQSSKRSMTELLLVGSFNSGTLLLNAEGFPLHNTGMVLANAARSGDMPEVNTVWDPSEQISYDQKFFIKLDEGKGKLIPLDDRLQEIFTFKQLQSYFTHGFRSMLSDGLIATAERVLARQGNAPQQNNPGSKPTHGHQEKRHGRKL